MLEQNLCDVCDRHCVLVVLGATGTLREKPDGRSFCASSFSHNYLTTERVRVIARCVELKILPACSGMGEPTSSAQAYETDESGSEQKHRGRHRNRLQGIE